MKILVLVKQVPDMESRFAIEEGGGWYDETDLAFRINEYDEYAIEEAVSVKERLKGEADITVLSFGPSRVREAIKKALAMGCDRGVHIDDPDYKNRDPYQTALAISTFAEEKNFDLIFAGNQSHDFSSAQVGPFVAEALNMGCVSAVVEFSYDNGVITVHKELEGGVRTIAKLSTPALITCHLGLNKPRYPTLPNIMKAKKKELLTVNAIDVLKTDSRVETHRVFTPEKRGAGEVVEGDVAEQVDRLVIILREKTSALS